MLLQPQNVAQTESISNKMVKQQPLGFVEVKKLVYIYSKKLYNLNLKSLVICVRMGAGSLNKRVGLKNSLNKVMDKEGLSKSSETETGGRSE